MRYRFPSRTRNAPPLHHRPLAPHAASGRQPLHAPLIARQPARWRWATIGNAACAVPVLVPDGEFPPSPRATPHRLRTDWPDERLAACGLTSPSSNPHPRRITQPLLFRDRPRRLVERAAASAGSGVDGWCRPAVRPRASLAQRRPDTQAENALTYAVPGASCSWGWGDMVVGRPGPHLGLIAGGSSTGCDLPAIRAGEEPAACSHRSTIIVACCSGGPRFRLRRGIELGAAGQRSPRFGVIRFSRGGDGCLLLAFLYPARSGRYFRAGLRTPAVGAVSGSSHPVLCASVFRAGAGVPWRCIPATGRSHEPFAAFVTAASAWPSQLLRTLRLPSMLFRLVSSTTAWCKIAPEAKSSRPYFSRQGPTRCAGRRTSDDPLRRAFDTYPRRDIWLCAPRSSWPEADGCRLRHQRLARYRRGLPRLAAPWGLALCSSGHDRP